LAQACAWSMYSVLISSTYTLYKPHIVGHLLPAASVIVVILYGLHCALLFWTDRCLRQPWELAALGAPFLGAAISACICYERYYRQLENPQFY
ncbi:MAG: hypothetical protein ACREP7_04680, partial [Lysobacter sp.]